MKLNITATNSLKKDLLVPVIFFSVYIILSSMWLYLSESSPLFDSSRFFLRINKILELKISDGLMVWFQKLIHILDFQSPLWMSLIAFLAKILKINTFNGIIILNNVVSYSMLFFLFYKFSRSYLSKRCAFYSLFFLGINPVIFNQTKVLMPEIFSLSIIILTVYCTSRCIFDPSFKNTAYLISLFFLSYFTNLSTLIFILPLFGFCLFKILKSGKPSHFISAAFILICTLLCFYLSKNIHSQLISPDLKGSWSNLEPGLSNFLKSLFWQIYGYINKTLGFFPFAAVVLSVLLQKKTDNISNKSIICIHFIYFIILCLIRPLVGMDFYVTGYRYQLPLLLITALLFGSSIKNISKNQQLLTATLLIFLSAETLFQSLPLNIINTFSVKVKIFPINNISRFLGFNGTITVFNGRNEIVSGGNESKIKLAPPSWEVLMKDSFEYLKDNETKNDLWITVLSPSEKIHHTSQNELIKLDKTWTIQSDQKNPFYTDKTKKMLNNLKFNVPEFYYKKSGTIFLRMSDYLFVHSTTEKSEPELIDIHDDLLYQFKKLKPSLKLVKIITLESEKLFIYQNPILHPSSLKYKQPASKNIEGYFLLKSKCPDDKIFLKIIKNTIKNESIVSLTPDELKSKILNSNGFTIIINSLKCLPQDILSYIKYYYEKGGNLWIMDDHTHATNNNMENKLKESSIENLMVHLGWKKYYYNSNPNDGLLYYDGNLQKAPPKIQLNGIEVFNGAKGINFHPKKGNVFPYRTSCSNTFPVLSVINNQTKMAVPIRFINFHKNPYNSELSSGRILYSSLKNEILLNNIKLLKDILYNFTYPIDLIDFWPSSLTIAKNDKCILKVKLRNRGQKPINERLTVYINRSEKNSSQIDVSTNLMPSQSKTISFKVRQGSLKDGFNSFDLEVRSNIFQKLSCGILKNVNKLTGISSKLKIKKNKLLIDQSDFIKGTNYYPSSNYDGFWLRPNLNEINKDFKTMKAMGLKMVRMHFIHHKWYEDFNTLYLNGKMTDLTPRYLENEIITSLLETAQLNGMILCLDLFSLVGKNMGSPNGWASDYKRFTDDNFIIAQDKFLFNFLKTTKSHSNLTIDLINEPQVEKEFKETIKKWIHNKIKLIKALRPDILITLGFKYPGMDIKELDYYSLHCDEFLPNPYINKPVLIQEFWPVKQNKLFKKTNDFNFFEASENSARLNYCGLMPFGFITPGNLYPNEGPDENWESELGTFLRSDRSIKNPPF